MRRLFHEIPEVLENTGHIAERCEANLDFTEYRFPSFSVPDGTTPDAYLSTLCQEKLPHKYLPISETVRLRLQEELDLIQRLGLSGYFLTVWDIVEFARRRGVPVQGRGSAANSLVAYLLGITPVDPIAHHLFLGRFLNEERTTIPDIDLDFAASREAGLFDREDVIQYVYERYGAEYVAMVCTFVTFQARSAIREVGKVFDLPSPLLDRMARLIQGSSSEAAFQNVAQMTEFRDYLRSPLWQHFREQVEAIIGVPRHLSIHVGGMIIASCPIPDLVPLESARMPGRVVCQWDKDMIEAAGLIKIDLLGLGMLSAIRETIHWVREAYGIALDWNQIPQEDPRVYQMIHEADTVGVFQVESRAQMQHLPRTRPENLTELAIQVALIRPGPLQGNMVEPYILRKQGREAVSYPHPKLEPILKETLGVILFQEQVLQVAVAVADYTPGQAEELRRALGKERSKKALGELREEFLQRAEAQGIATGEAAKIFGYLEGFAGYGFCKSHALSFAHLAYISGWLRVYYPPAFFAALMNNQPMGFYPLEVLVQDAKRQGISVGVVDVNHSRARCHVEASDDGPRLRLGLSLVKGLGMPQSERIEQIGSEQGTYASLRDFSQKTDLEIPKIERLIEAGAFDSLGLSRRELLWQLWILEQWPELSDQLVEPDLLPPKLPHLGDWEVLMSEYRSMGFSARLHPMQILRKQLPGVYTSNQISTFGSGVAVRVAGLVVGRQRPPTARGFAFLTLEDEYGMMNIIVSPKLCDQDPVLFRLSPMMIVEGTLQKQDGVINVRADTLHKIPQEGRG